MFGEGKIQFNFENTIHTLSGSLIQVFTRTFK